MKNPLKKTLKIVLWTLGGLVALVVLLVATLPLWLSPVVCPIVNKVAPEITKTDFRLEKLSVNPWTARVEVGGLLVGNPEGYSDPRAVELKQFVVDVRLFSLLTKVIHVEEVTIRDCFVSYSVGGTNKIDNVKQILANVTGEQPAAEDPEAAKELEEAAKDVNAAAQDGKPKEVAKDDDAAEAPAEEEGPSLIDQYKIIIDRVTVDGVKVKLQMVTFPSLSITLNDIGKDSGGVKVTDALGIIWDRILKGSTNIGDAAGAAADAIGEGAGKAADAIGEGAEKAADALKGLFSK
jgi:hypothetical protein